MDAPFTSRICHSCLRMCCNCLVCCPNSSRLQKPPNVHWTEGPLALAYPSHTHRSQGTHNAHINDWLSRLCRKSTRNGHSITTCWTRKDQIVLNRMSRILRIAPRRQVPTAFCLLSELFNTTAWQFAGKLATLIFIKVVGRSVIHGNL